MGRVQEAIYRSNRDKQAETQAYPSQHAHQHSQPSINIPEPRQMGRVQEAKGRSNKDKQAETQAYPSQHAY